MLFKNRKKERKSFYLILDSDPSKGFVNLLYMNMRETAMQSFEGPEESLSRAINNERQY